MSSYPGLVKEGFDFLPDRGFFSHVPLSFEKGPEHFNRGVHNLDPKNRPHLKATCCIDAAQLNAPEHDMGSVMDIIPHQIVGVDDPFDANQ
jgi:hypothetical protein